VRAFSLGRHLPRVRSRGFGQPLVNLRPDADPTSRESAEAVEELSWHDMQMIFATRFANEIAAVTEGGGGALLRERVGSLDMDQRQLLGEALDATAVA
jgi:hypothetical protein